MNKNERVNHQERKTIKLKENIKSHILNLDSCYDSPRRLIAQRNTVTHFSHRVVLGLVCDSNTTI